MATDDLSLALHLAGIARGIAMSWAGGGVPHTLKPDGSPVTEADLEVNSVLLEELADARPADGVLSEEEPERPGSSGRRWIIDPIDGTKLFLAGRPGWGTHIALEEDGDITLGVITRPEDDLVLWAARGAGAHRTTLSDPTTADTDPASRLQLSAVRDLAGAQTSGYGPGTDPDLQTLAEHSQFARDPHSPIVPFLSGELGALLLVGGQVWDYAPLVPLVIEAGGDLRSRDGRQALDQHWLLCANEGLREPLSDLLLRS